MSPSQNVVVTICVQLEKTVRDEQKRRVDDFADLLGSLRDKWKEIDQGTEDEKMQRLQLEKATKKVVQALQKDQREMIAKVNDKTAQRYSYVETVLRTEISARMKSEERMRQYLEGEQRHTQRSMEQLRVRLVEISAYWMSDAIILNCVWRNLRRKAWPPRYRSILRK